MQVKWLVEDFEGDGKLDPLIAEIKKTELIKVGEL